MPGTAYPADYSSTYSGPQFTSTMGRTALAAAMAGATAARPLGGMSGVRPGTPTTIATATTTAWTVTPFGGYVDLATTATNGGYFFSFQANQTGTMTAAVASARVDLLYVQCNDVNTSDGSAQAPNVVIGYQAGTGGAGIPTLSAARSFVIAQINVPASGGGSPTVTWVGPYAVAAGGIQSVLASTGYPTSPSEGIALWDRTLKSLVVYDATRWVATPKIVVSTAASSTISGTQWDGVSPLITQAGLVSGTTNTGSGLVGTFPIPFPHGLVSISANAYNAAGVTGRQFADAGSTLTGPNFQILTSSGAGVASTSQAYMYIAVGW